MKTVINTICACLLTLTLLFIWQGAIGNASSNMGFGNESDSRVHARYDDDLDCPSKRPCKLTSHDHEFNKPCSGDACYYTGKHKHNGEGK
jgi:hypothetical protein